MTDVKFVSQHDLRVQFVQEALEKNSDLDGKVAHDLAVHVVYAIDHIPEKTR
jgi:hypothetical protein